MVENCNWCELYAKIQFNPHTEQICFSALKTSQFTLFIFSLWGSHKTHRPAYLSNDEILTHIHAGFHAKCLNLNKHESDRQISVKIHIIKFHENTP